MDTKTAGAVAVEALSQSHPKDPSGEEANMVATPAVGAVEAQSLSHPNTTTGKEATMVASSAAAVAERGEVSPSSTSTPNETPVKGGKGAKEERRRRFDRTSFDRNAATALRVKNVGYTSPVAAMFVKSTTAATHAERALAEKLRQQDGSSRALTELTGKLLFSIGRLLALCRYLAIDIDQLLARARLTLAKLRARQSPQAIDAAFRLSNLLMLPDTDVPDVLRQEARGLFKTAKACSAALKASEVHDPDVEPLRDAFSAAVKANNDDYWLLVAEIRHADARQGTNWRGHLLMPEEPTKRRSRSPGEPVNNDPNALKEAKGSNSVK